MSRTKGPQDDRAGSLVDERGWEAHLAAHRIFEAHLEGILSAAERPLEALVRGVDLRRQLTRHIHFEDGEVVPKMQDEAAAANVLRDHRLIREGGKRLEEAALLAHFGRVDPRRLRQRWVELARLLDHHDEREEQQVYGPLAVELTTEARAQLLRSLAATPLLAPLDGPTVAAIADHETIRALCSRYRAWLDTEPLPPTSEVPLEALDVATAGNVTKLLARDDRVVAAERRLAAGSPRERAEAEQLADVSLRSTITFVIEALLRD